MFHGTDLVLNTESVAPNISYMQTLQNQEITYVQNSYCDHINFAGCIYVAHSSTSHPLPSTIYVEVCAWLEM